MALEVFAGLRLVQHLPQSNDILQAVDHPGVGRLAVTPGAARFLVIRFHALGQIQMCHESHIGFVDAHAERDGCNDDDTVLGEKPALMLMAGIGFQTCVIRQGVEALRYQPFGRGFRFFA